MRVISIQLVFAQTSHKFRRYFCAINWIVLTPVCCTYLLQYYCLECTLKYYFVQCQTNERVSVYTRDTYIYIYTLKIFLINRSFVFFFNYFIFIFQYLKYFFLHSKCIFYMHLCPNICLSEFTLDIDVNDYVSTGFNSYLKDKKNNKRTYSRFKNVFNGL